MPVLEPVFATKVAGTLTAGIIQQAGARFARKLKKTEVQKALGRCGEAALEALIEDGFPNGTDIPGDHLQDVLRQFAADDVVHDILAGAIRNGKLAPAEIAELRESFEEAHPLETLPGFDLERAIAGFVTAFISQADEEEAFQGLIQTKELKKQTRHLHALLDESRQQTELQEEQTEVQKQIRDRLPSAEKQEAEARLRYLRALRRRCLLLPVARLLDAETGARPVTLDRVYIEMDTRTPKERTGKVVKKGRVGRFQVEVEEALSVVEAFEATDHLVLLGGAGSGKSTVAKALLAWIAASALGDAAEPPAGVAGDSIPVLLVLRELSGRLEALDVDDLPGEKRLRSLAEAVQEQALADLADEYRVPELASGLSKAFDEHRVVLALDGLDEVPAHLRERVRDAVLAARNLFEPRKILVTCRVRSYGGGFALPGFEVHEVAPLDEEKIQTFCRTWYRAQGDLGRLEESKVDEGGEHLARQVLEDPLRELAGNPLLLTTMAIIHLQKAELPRGRAQVYEDAIRLLVRDWQAERVGKKRMAESKGLHDFLSDDARLWSVLQRIAYEAHRVGGTAHEEAAGLPKGDLWTLLSAPEYLGSAALAEEFLDYADQSAGLLVGLGGKPGQPAAFGFVHRTFQEYLAGRYLTSRWNTVDELYARAGEADLWDLAVELGSEALLHVDRKPIELLRIIYGLGQAHRDESLRFKRATLWAAKMAAILGGSSVEQDREGPVKGKEFLAELRPKLVGLLGSDLPPVERAEAGRALARLGDPRAEVVEVDAIEFCRVPGGQFLMGSERWEREEAHRATPQHEFDLPYEYWISRYPVTGAQYRKFVDEGGYLRERYWPEARDHGLWHDGRVRTWWKGSFSTGPARLGAPWDLENQPIVGVTWYETLAFCRWLSERWRRDGRLPAGWSVHLPSEPEWEKAARGGLKVVAVPETGRADAGWKGRSEDEADLVHNPNSNRFFPWGDEFSADLANTIESGMGAPTALGCYPDGSSPYGCEEMAGNVLEWTRSLWGDYPYPNEPAERAAREDLASEEERVVRGGGYHVAARFARCSARNDNHPHLPYYYFGFRLLASSFSTGL